MLFINCHLEQYFFKIKLVKQTIKINMTCTVLETKCSHGKTVTAEILQKKTKKKTFDQCKFKEYVQCLFDKIGNY